MTHMIHIFLGKRKTLDSWIWKVGCFSKFSSKSKNFLNNFQPLLLQRNISLFTAFQLFLAAYQAFDCFVTDLNFGQKIADRIFANLKRKQIADQALLPPFSIAIPLLSTPPDFKEDHLIGLSGHHRNNNYHNFWSFMSSPDHNFYHTSISGSCQLEGVVENLPVNVLLVPVHRCDSRYLWTFMMILLWSWWWLQWWLWWL